jgi:preprotein translocase subunit SecD
MLFMIIYYRLPGLMASLSLVFYGTLALAIYKLWPAPQITLTLAGLGGFIASIGMAVVANILIFERMKEELRRGARWGQLSRPVLPGPGRPSGTAILPPLSPV